MKKTLVMIFVSLMVGLTACQPVENEDLEMELLEGEARAFSFPIKSCTDEVNGSTVESLKAASADFGTLSFRWYGKSQLTIKTITVKLQGSSLESTYYKDFNTTELNDTFLGTPTIISAAVDNVTPTLYTTGCSIRVGGIAFKDPNTNGFALGKLILTGIIEDDEGTRDVIVVNKDISVNYQAPPK